MSELINNREHRQKVLKELIMELHDGKNVEEVRERFAELIEGVSVAEISQMEQALIMEGMPVEEVQRLCDVHAAVFKGSIEDIHKPQKLSETPGHPLNTFIVENRLLKDHIEENVKPSLEAFETMPSKGTRQQLLDQFKVLSDVDKPYARKENLLFPYLEKAGITGPPKVMWGVDDEIRADIKKAISLLSYDDKDKDVVIEAVNQALNKITEMIFKEENILFPLAEETLSEDEWIKIAEQSSEIGYFMIDRTPKWQPERTNVTKKASKESSDRDAITFKTGAMTPKEIEAVFNALPIDITFVDKDGIVRFFNQVEDRIFPRPTTVIGRTVQNCHPPSSVHVVEKIVEDLMSGKKDHEDFWIKKGQVYALIRYYAVRDENGEYVGTIEVTQDIKPLQEIKGEKRLLTD